MSNLQLFHEQISLFYAFYAYRMKNAGFSICMSESMKVVLEFYVPMLCIFAHVAGIFLTKEGGFAALLTCILFLFQSGYD